LENEEDPNIFSHIWMTARLGFSLNFSKGKQVEEKQALDGVTVWIFRRWP
jgi:hypothetical protein